MKKTITLLTALMFIIVISKAQTNYLDSYIGNSPTMTVIATSANQLNMPQDLDFKPGTNELWVCQYGDATGGSMDIFYNAGMSSQTNQLRHDSHADHFYYYPSAIAFSNIGELANTNEIQNTSSSSTTFMGPALWLADTAIFANIWQGGWSNGYPLGSHIDMLHQSPFSMGIAWDSAKAYWVMDGYNGNICKYDFVNDHSPGYDNHSAGKIWRYSDVTVTRVPQVPSHMVLDKTNGWLYFIDGGSKKVKRMNVNNGVISGTLTVPSTANESLAGYWNVLGSTVQTLDSLTTQPCGMDYYNGRLVVSDYTNGNIYLYNTAGTFSILDTIVTGHPGMMGVKIGNDGHIWCVNKTENKIYRLDVALPALDAAIVKITSPNVVPFLSKYYSVIFDVCSGTITPSVDVKNTGSTAITSMEIHYSIDGGTHTVYSWNGSLASGSTTSVALPNGAITYGAHRLDVMIMMVNGMADDVEMNNNMMGSFRAFTPVQNLPFTENFNVTSFPPPNWSYVHFNTNDFMSHSAAGGFGNSTGSMMMNNYSGTTDITGQKDYLMSPLLNFTSISSNTYLHFDVAYAQYNTSSVDELKILASSDCGNSWTQVYDKSGAALSTAPPATAAFSPTSSQWRTDNSINLNSFSGQSEVMFMFTSISNFGNNFFIDNIGIGAYNLGINETDNSVSFSVFPNPATEEVTVEFSTLATSKIIVTDILGKNIFSQEIPFGQKSVQLNTSLWDNGFYFVTVKSGIDTGTQKLVVEK